MNLKSSELLTSCGYFCCFGQTVEWYSHCSEKSFRCHLFCFSNSETILIKCSNSVVIPSLSTVLTPKRLIASLLHSINLAINSHSVTFFSKTSL